MISLRAQYLGVDADELCELLEEYDDDGDGWYDRTELRNLGEHVQVLNAKRAEAIAALAAGATESRGKAEDDASPAQASLTGSPQEQKNAIGERLYPLIVERAARHWQRRSLSPAWNSWTSFVAHSNEAEKAKVDTDHGIAPAETEATEAPAAGAEGKPKEIANIKEFLQACRRPSVTGFMFKTVDDTFEIHIASTEPSVLVITDKEKAEKLLQSLPPEVPLSGGFDEANALVPAESEVVINDNVSFYAATEPAEGTPAPKPELSDKTPAAAASPTEDSAVEPIIGENATSYAKTEPAEGTPAPKPELSDKTPAVAASPAPPAESDVQLNENVSFYAKTEPAESVVQPKPELVAAGGE